MRKLRCVFAMAALVAAFGLLAAVPAGQSRAAEKEKPDPEKEKKVEAGARAVKDIATAYDLIDIARRPKKEKPIVLITAVDLLVTAGEGDKKTDVEGGGDGKTAEFHEQLKALLQEAADMPGGKSDAAKALADDVMTKVEASEKLKKAGRGTATGHTYREAIVDPINPATDAPVVKINQKFIGGLPATVCVAKVVNKGVPLDVRVVGPDGKVFFHDKGNSLRVDWRVPNNVGDPVYQIQIRNHHSVGVGVRVTTN